MIRKISSIIVLFFSYSNFAQGADPREAIYNTQTNAAGQVTAHCRWVPEDGPQGPYVGYAFDTIHKVDFDYSRRFKVEETRNGRCRKISISFPQKSGEVTHMTSQEICRNREDLTRMYENIHLVDRPKSENGYGLIKMRNGQTQLRTGGGIEGPLFGKDGMKSFNLLVSPNYRDQSSRTTMSATHVSFFRSKRQTDIDSNPGGLFNDEGQLIYRRRLYPRHKNRQQVSNCFEVDAFQAEGSIYANGHARKTFDQNIQAWADFIRAYGVESEETVRPTEQAAAATNN